MKKKMISSMILKSIKIILSLAFVLQAVSCSNIIDKEAKTSTVEEITQNPSADTKLARLTVSVKDAPFKDEPTENAARTICPDASGFKFSLDAVDSENNPVAGFSQSWNSYYLMQKDGDITIAPGTYTFTLTIKDSDGNVAYTSTIENQTVGSGDNALVFKIEEGDTGNLDLTIFIYKDWDIASVEVALYNDISSTTPIEGTYQKFTVENADDTYKPKYEKTLPVGSYIIKCKFTNSKGDEVSKGYMDVVQIKNVFPTAASIYVSSYEYFYFKYSDSSGKCDYRFATTPGEEVNLLELFTSNFGDLSSDNVKFKTNNPDFTVSEDGILSSASSYTVSSSPEILDVTILSKKTGKPMTVKFLVDDDLILTQAKYRAICSYYGANYGYNEYRNSSFTIPHGYKGIANGTETTGVFNGSTYLSYVYLPETLETIGDYAFYKLTKLATVGIPNGIYTVKELPKGLKSIGKYAFAESGITGTKLYNDVETIGDYAFYKCTSLTSVTLRDSSDTENPPKLKNISNSAFEGCTALTSISIPNSVESIGDSAFSGCTNTRLTSISIPASVETIGKSAFKSTNLKYAYFDNETGWKVYDSESNCKNDENGTAVDVSSSSTSATYLKNTYKDKYWGRRD